MAPTAASLWKDPAQQKKFIENNPDAGKITSYVVRSDKLNEEYVCSLCERIDCSENFLPRVSGKYINGKNNLLFCFPCDRVFHLNCLKIQDLKNSETPWMCPDCIQDPNNEAAIAVPENSRLMSLNERLSAVCKQIVFDSEEDDEVTTAFFEESLRLEKQQGRFKLSDIKARFEEQQNEVRKVMQQKEEIEIKLAELSSILDAKEEELKLLRVDISRREETTEKIPGIIYANPATTSAPHLHIPHHTSFLTSQLETSATIEAIQKLELNQLRNVLPIVKEYSGDPAKWLTFERQVKLIQAEGKYNEQFMKHILRDKLTGLAAKLADKLFDTHHFDAIMEKLRQAFGNPQIVVNSARAQVLEIKLPRTLTQAAIIEATTTISNYLQACKQAKIESHDRSLALHLFKQLESRYAESYFMYFKVHHPNETKQERLDILNEFLDSICDTLALGTFTSIDNKETKAKSSDKSSFQLASIASVDTTSSKTTSSHSRGSTRAPTTKSRADAFEIRDIKEARFQGYFLDKLNAIPYNCLLCNRKGHYTVQCREYYKKTVEERQNFVNAKQLCGACVITTEHKARNCPLKKQCGIRLPNGTRCELKHHLSLHSRAQPRNKQNSSLPPPRSNNAASEGTSSSTNADKYKGLPVSHDSSMLSAVFANMSPRGYQLCALSANVTSSPRTIKLFRTVITHDGKTAAAFAVGDSAAEVSIVKRSLVDELGITGPPCAFSVQWTDNSIKQVTAIKVNLLIRGIHPGGREFIISECYALDDFELPPRTLNVDELKRMHPHLRSIPFENYNNASPAILLGSRHAALVEAIKLWEHGEGQPIGVLTKLGYSIYGASNDQEQLDLLNAIASQTIDDDRLENFVTNEELSRQIELASSLESLQLKPIGTQLTADEKSAIAQAEAGLMYLPSRHVQMPLMWRLVDGQKPKLPDNFGMVLRRQLAQEKKLSKNPQLLEAFNQNFKTLIDEGYVRAAAEEDMKTQNSVNYVPMSLVVNANKRPIKYRNVYDASAKFKGTSLNSNLLPGPNLLVDLLKPLMSMRENAIAVTGDIKAMFNRIVIDPTDQNAQRILWRSSPSDPMQIFIHTAMMFGPSCSPFVSQYVKNWAAKCHANKYPDTAKSVEDNSYMDDWFASFATVAEALKCLKEAIEIFDAINMQLVGIQSNSPELLASIPKDYLKKEIVPLLSGALEHFVSKVLGVQWNISVDCLVFELREQQLQDKFLEAGIKPTKRDLCSIIARVFDIIGLLAHCIIRGRIILQYCWRKQIDWDMQITDEDAILWSNWLKDLRKAATVQIPRRRSILDRFSDARSIELHTFCDAGKEATAAVSYFVAAHSGIREPSFVMAKSKVAPLRLKSKSTISEMPRLEVIAAVIGARQHHHVVELHEHLTLKHFLWCDSEIVLRWIRNENLKLPKFAASPINEILELTQTSQWRYVDTKINVADIATKFQKFEFDNSNSNWFTGPDFLKEESSFWPEQKIPKDKLQAATLCAHHLVCEDNAIHYKHRVKENPLELLPKCLPQYECPQMALIDKITGEIRHSAIMTLLMERMPSVYYSWPKLVRATARMLSTRSEIFIPLLKAKKWRSRSARREVIETSQIRDTINPIHTHRAELFLIRYMQGLKWSKEIEKLKQGRRINNPELLKLNAFLDNDGILRVNSRVSLPFSEYPQKYAPIVPRLDGKDSLTQTMMFHYHQKHKHIDLGAQMAEFRSKFWMTALKEWLKAIVYRCNYCKLERSQPRPPLMAELPSFRVDRKLKPFEVTGLDCCGPFTVKVRNKPQKIWILLFTCTTTRFIHVEILENIDTQSTLAAIMSAYAAHGPLVNLISDQGTNFVGTSNLLFKEQEKIIKELKKTTRGVNEHFAKNLKDFRWEFTPVRASWFGGFYERLIGELKRGLREEIRSKDISMVTFKIALYETAHRLNCRPLTYLPVSPDEEEPLTPHHMAKNRPGWPLLPSAHTLRESGKKIADRSFYVEAQKLADRITKRFYKLYLPELTLRTKWNKKQPPLEINDLVLIIDPNQTRSQWKKGLIRSFRPSRDGTPRVAEVETADGNKKARAVNHLVKIDIRRS